MKIGGAQEFSELKKELHPNPWLEKTQRLRDGELRFRNLRLPLLLR